MLIYKSKTISNRKGLSFRLLTSVHSIAIILIACSLGNSMKLHAQNTFSYVFKKPGMDLATFMIEDSEGSIIAAGTQSMYITPSKGSLWKIDKNNDTLSRTYGYPDKDLYFDYIEETANGEYLVFGCIGDTSNNVTTQLVFFRLNRDLEIVWQKTMDLNYELYSSIFKKSGDYYYLLMSATPTPNTQCDPFFIKFNSEFDTVRTYHSGYMLGGQYIEDFMFSKDGSQLYVFGASFIPLPYGELRDEIVFYDTTFNYLGFHKFPKDELIGDYSIYMQGQYLTDTTLLMYCNYTDFSDFKSQHCFMEMDTAMNIYNRIFIGVADTNDHGCLTSHTYSFSNPDSIHYAGTKNLIVSFQPDEISWLRIGMLNRQLQPYYMRYYGGDAQYWIEFVLHTRDGGMVIQAMRLEDFTYTDSDWDAFFLKVNSEGLITSISPLTICPERTFIISPNPGCDQTLLNLILPEAILYVYNCTGQMIFQQPLKAGANQINTTELAKGVYLFTVKDKKNYVNTQKWIKQ